MTASPSMTRNCSRATKGTTSVHPEHTSVATKLHKKVPCIESPQWATKSTSRNPGSGSFQSAKVRMGICRLDFVAGLRFRHRPAVPRIGARSRSIVAGLTAKRCCRTIGSRARCPFRSSAEMRPGRMAFRRFPQMRSAASQSTMSASRTDDAANQGLAHGHAPDAAGALDLVTFFDLGVFAEDDHADLIFFKVHGNAGDAMREAEELAGHDLGEA